MISEQERKEILESFGAGGEEAAELLAYNTNRFAASGEQHGHPPSFPLPDEPFVTAWQRYFQEAETMPPFEVLKKHMIQLHFPIQSGSSETEAYRQAISLGILPQHGTGRDCRHNSLGGSTPPEGITLARPDLLEVSLYSSAAGRIPIIYTRHRADFIQLVQALAYRNEPVPIPDSVGACMVSGFRNRVHLLGNGEHRDRFILMSDGPYSGVPAEAIGLDADTWKAMSFTIRREHECAHYLTRRLFASMQNRMFDELIADYAGIVAANGTYRADWFLHFIGLEHYPAYREGGRLQYYRGTPPLSDGAFHILQDMLFQAAHHLENMDRNRTMPVPLVERMLKLCSMTLEELAIGIRQDPH